MSRRNRPPSHARVNGESERSRKYRAGKAIRYAGRIHGPTFPVVIKTIDDLPDDSVLKPIARAMHEIANDPMNDIDLGLKLGHGKAYQ